MDFLLLKDLLIILAVSVVVLLMGYRLGIPPVVGFILTGVLSGPHGLGLIGETHDVENLAEIGIILLLFGIGMEFSLKKLVQIKKQFLLGGSLQVGLTILFTVLIVNVFGSYWAEGLFLGFLICMSSTAIVLGILDQKSESASPHGRLSISILIFQDMIAIPMILMTPLLAKGNISLQQIDVALIWQFVKGLLILGAVFVSAQHLVPRLLLQVARTRNKELFLLCVLVLCFGVAYLTSSMGLSLTIGAFLAGLIISESEYSNEAISNIFPLQALFISFFFVSVGMLLNVDFLMHHFLLVLGLATGVLLLKITTGGLTAILLGYPIRTAIMTCILLSQVGEFSFVLAKTGIGYGLGSDFEYQLFLSVALITLMISPLLIDFAPKIAAWMMKIPFPDPIIHGRKADAVCATKNLEQHVIIVGFGMSGRHLASSCKLSGIPYVILEMNPDTVNEQKKAGEPIHYGDASQLSNLHHLNLDRARAIAVLINDPRAAKRVVKLARENNQSIYIIVRARFVQEMALMQNLGADEVIPDEFGTSIEIFSRVLQQYHVPQDDITNLIRDIRMDGYEMLRKPNMISTKLSEIKINLSNIEIGSFRLRQDSNLVGKSLLESQLRQEYGITVILIKRDNQVISHPTPDIVFQVNDILVVIGETVSLKNSEDVFGRLQKTAVLA